MAGQSSSWNQAPRIISLSRRRSRREYMTSEQPHSGQDPVIWQTSRAEAPFAVSRGTDRTGIRVGSKRIREEASASPLAVKCAYLLIRPPQTERGRARGDPDPPPGWSVDLRLGTRVGVQHGLGLGV